MSSVLQRLPEEITVYRKLSKRMRTLCGNPTELLRPYTQHLQALGFNWPLYQSHPKYKDKLTDLKSTDAESKFDEVILRLVKVLDEEWVSPLIEKTQTALQAITPRVGGWKFDVERNTAFAVFLETQKALDAVITLRNSRIEATVMYTADINRRPYVVIRDVFSQVKKMKAPSESLQSAPRP